MSEPTAVVGVIFAEALEGDAFARIAAPRRELRAVGLTIHEGAVAGVPVVWCIAGVGADAARRATRLVLAGHAPRLLVSAGFAGGLDPRLARGSLIRPARVVLPAGDPIELAHGSQDAGTVVTVERVVATVAEKQRLAGDTGAAIVDMETHAVAAEARAAGLPCAAVRVVSDAAAEPLPGELAVLTAPRSGWRRLGDAMAAIGRRPGLALDLWRLYENAVIDGRALGAALAELCTALAAEWRFNTGPHTAARADPAAGRRRAPEP